MKIIKGIAVLILCAALTCCLGLGSNSNHGKTIEFVQAANVTSLATVDNPVSTYTATFANNVPSGDLIVIAFWWNYPPGSNVVSVTDTGGNSYQQALVTPPGNDNNAWIYYAANVSGGSPLSVTVAVSVSTGDQFSMAALEYSGLTALDVTSSNAGSLTGDSTTSTSGDAVTREANELIVGVSLSNELNTTVAGIGFTSRFASNYWMVEDKIVSSPGTYDSEFFLPNGCQYCAWEAGMATFH